MAYEYDHLSSGHARGGETEFSVNDPVELFNCERVFKRDACGREAYLVFALVFFVFSWIPVEVEHQDVLSTGIHATSAQLCSWGAKRTEAFCAGWPIEAKAMMKDSARICLAVARDACVLSEKATVDAWLQTGSSLE